MAADRLAYSPADAAEAVGVSERTILRAITAGDLVARYIGKSPRIPVDDLRAWFDALPTERPKR